MSSSRAEFRATEYVAPVILILMLTAALVWLAMRLWRQSETAPPEPTPGISDYRMANPSVK